MTDATPHLLTRLQSFIRSLPTQPDSGGFEALLLRSVLVAALLALFLGCGMEPTADAPSNPQDRAAESRCQLQSPPQQSASEGFDLYSCEENGRTWREIVDRRNQSRITLASPPQRVVSQSLGSDEILLQLMPEAEIHRLVAVSALSRSERYSDMTEQAQEIGRFITDKTEEILALGPDLVLAASYTTPETLQQLENAKVPTLVLHQFAGVDDISSNIRTLAFALSLDAAGEQMLEDLNQQIDEAKTLLQPILQSRGSVPVVAYGSGSVYASGTTFHDLAQRLGLKNMPADAGLQGWPKADQEQLLTWKPELVFLASPSGSEDRSAMFFRETAPALFESSTPPRLVVLPGNLFSTVSQRIGALAVGMAEQTREALTAERDPLLHPPASSRTNP